MNERARVLRAALTDLENVLNNVDNSRKSIRNIEFRGKTVLAQTHSNILPLIRHAQKQAEQEKAARIANGITLGAWQLTVQEPLADLNQEVVEGFNVMLYAKIFLFIFLLDLDSSYFTITAAIFFLHANGLFGPIGRWFRRYRQRAARRHDAPAAAAPTPEEEQRTARSPRGSARAWWSLTGTTKQIFDVLVAFIKSLWPVTEN